MLDPNHPYNKLFEITKESTRVTLAKGVVETWVQGKICPPNGELPIIFLIESEVTGVSK